MHVPRTTEIKIRGYHLDFYGHVNNARYLEFLEEARWGLFEDRLDLMAWRKRGRAFFVVNININFRRPAGLGDRLEVTGRFARFGRRSAVLRQEILRQGTVTVIADAEVTFVIADLQSGVALPLEGELRALIESLAPGPAEEPAGGPARRM
jgi:thioesterase-3